MNPIKTRNVVWGAWGTAETAGLEPQATWDALCDYFTREQKIAPNVTRAMLDSKFGRHLVDDLSFIRGPVNYLTIRNHLARRFELTGWKRYLNQAALEARQTIMHAV